MVFLLESRRFLTLAVAGLLAITFFFGRTIILGTSTLVPYSNDYFSQRTRGALYGVKSLTDLRSVVNEQYPMVLLTTR